MSFLDSLLVAVFGLSLVFAVLIALSGVVTLESKIFSMFKAKRGADPVKEEPVSLYVEPVVDSGVTAGELKLFAVDERTAAMIMAIVSDQSSIPLSELQFKSIKALD